jgi:hypothetical protein
MSALTSVVFALLGCALKPVASILTEGGPTRSVELGGLGV